MSASPKPGAARPGVPGLPPAWREAAQAALARWLPRVLPFADAASTDLPIGRLLRLSLFQLSVGIATALLVGTLNRVMIVELHVAAWLVSAMVALPLLVAPFRALVGHRSDHHRSVFGWKRVPYVWIGTLMQFGGLAIMPFALLVLGGDVTYPAWGWVGTLAAGLAFLLVGAGVQTTQTAGLALATDLAPQDKRPRVVALMYVMLLVGMVGSGLVFGWLLAEFQEVRLIRIIQGAAVVSVVLNLVAVWKQEPRDAARAGQVRRGEIAAPAFGAAWRRFVANRRARRFLWTVALGTAAFNMQDIILEPYGGEILHLGVGATSALTAILAAGALAAFVLAARWLSHGHDPLRVAAWGAVLGLPAFSLVIFASPMDSPWMFRAGAALIGFGGGLFAVGTLSAAMALEDASQVGLALGAWGAVQATAAGGAVAAGGAIRDVVSSLATRGFLGPVLVDPSTGYAAVYHLEMLLLFAALVAIGPLVSRAPARHDGPRGRFGLADLPG